MPGFRTVGNYQSTDNAANESFRTLAATAFSTSHCLFEFRKFEEPTSAMCCPQTLVNYMQKLSTAHAHIS